MADIRIYDWEFNLLHIEPDIISSNWSIYYNDIGTFEAHFDDTSGIVPIVLNNPYLIAVQGDLQAIITSKQAAGREVVLYGRTVNWLLTRRATPQFTANDLEVEGKINSRDVETVARYLVAQAFNDVDNFMLGSMAGFTEQIPFWRNTTNVTADVIKDCLANDNAGHLLRYDIVNKKWVFEVIKGKTLDIVVSEGNCNAYDTEYTDDILNCYTGGWYNYQPESEEGQEQQPAEWMYINGDTTKTGIYKWDTVLSCNNESEAASELKKKIRKEKIQTKIRNLVYGIDYNLGDVLKLQKVTGNHRITHEKRITGVNLWYEHEGSGAQPIFED